MLRSEADPLKRVVVCTPRREYFRVPDLQAHNMTTPADPEATQRQHARLCTTMADFGAVVIDLPELADHPNSVFTRDVAVVTPGGYIRLRMGLPTRRSEPTWMAAALDELGEPCVGSIEAPGTVEGGDVILAGKVAFVGQSGRTNAEGLRQLARLLDKMGYQLRAAQVPTRHLHIGGAMSLIAPERVLCCAGVFPDGFFEGFDQIVVPGDSLVSGNVITLAPNEVIADRAHAVTLEALDRAGVVVHTLDLSEFLKGTGGPSCLILPLERHE